MTTVIITGDPMAPILKSDMSEPWHQEQTRHFWARRGLRIGLALAGTCIGWVSISANLAQVVAKFDLALAHRLAPGNGRITALAASALAGPEASAGDRQRADRLARKALQQDPTAVRAVSTLGLDTQIRGDTDGAGRLFAYVQALSRRDLQSQVWAIENFVRHGDIDGALRHYDIALRTTPQGSGALFPVLGAAISNPAIRAALIQTLAGKPMWAESFITYVAGTGPDPRSTIRFFLGLRRAGVAVADSSSAAVIERLIAMGFINDAWMFYAATHSGTDRRSSRDPGFIGDAETPTVFDWIAINGNGISSSLQRGLFEFAAPASIGGHLLRQVQMLPPGDYHLTGRSGGIDQAEGARPYWVLICQGGAEIGRVVLPESARADGRFTGLLRVPKACPVQTLELVARPSDAVAGVSGRIEQVQLSPLENPR